MNKKAIAKRTLTLLILSCVTAIILAIFIGRWAITMEKGENIEICRGSIILAAQSKIVGNEAWTPLDCPRTDLLIKKGDVVRNGVIDQERVHKIVADSMAECWYMYGEGKIDPFSNWDNTGENYCLICKTIKFDKKLTSFILSKGDEMVEGDSINNENFKKYFPTLPTLYLMENNYKTTGKTYYEYLYNVEPQTISTEDRQSLEMLPLIPDSTIFLTMYKYKSKSTAWKIVGVVTAATLIIGGIVAGVFTLGAGLSLTAVGLGLLATALTGGGALLGVHTSHKTFEYCTDCDGVGGVKIYPPGIDFSTKEEICTQNCDDPDSSKWETEEIAACTIIAN